MPLAATELIEALNTPRDLLAEAAGAAEAAAA
jgi:hypothetical protein